MGIHNTKQTFVSSRIKNSMFQQTCSHLFLIIELSKFLTLYIKRHNFLKYEEFASVLETSFQFHGPVNQHLMADLVSFENY